MKYKLLESPLVLIFLISLTRLPLLFLCYGSDGDAWRVAWSGSTLWNEGIYQPSRFPGFPVYEIVNAPLVGLGGSLLSNLATLLCFIFAVVLFRKLLIEFQIQRLNLLVWTFAFMPILWKNSAVTMDYIWGMMLIVLSCLLVTQKKLMLSAIVLGIAVGTRASHIVFLIPLWFLLEPKSRAKEFIILSSVTIAVSIILYFPVLLRSDLYNEIMVTLEGISHSGLLRHIGFFVYRSVYAVGLFGTLGILIFLGLNRKQFISALRRKDRRLLTCVAAVVVTLTVFFILADEREYLIAMIPFLLIGIGLLFAEHQLKICCFLLLSYIVINIDLVTHDFGRQKFSLSVAPGMVVADAQKRKKFLEVREALPYYPLNDSSVLMTGWGPIFWFDNRHLAHTAEVMRMFRDVDASVSRFKPHVYYVYSLPYAELQKLKRNGYEIYYVQGMKGYIESFLHYDLDTAGAQPIQIDIP